MKMRCFLMAFVVLTMFSTAATYAALPKSDDGVKFPDPGKSCFLDSSKSCTWDGASNPNLNCVTCYAKDTTTGTPYSGSYCQAKNLAVPPGKTNYQMEQEAGKKAILGCGNTKGSIGGVGGR